ncbi:ABC transporter ATP-binding protein [Butyrivibrio sp. INlla16]|uniref:ABC transporter ATP-binding protein n=1 Tax=Butyrivibrio sp. INlla16 TaxID=1520807 RepID=UPI00088B3CC4|nr:ABC transporter ATP-binding protein [Butyrivibrio sp. INlla16]SDB63053.1 lipopolysaccharide transport system ATP-binding protein [Butyrivibrio sp. INlla16]
MSSIELKNIGLEFNVWHQKSIKDILVPGSNKFSTFENGKVRALNNISLSLKDGDRLAIIGHNGAGKSTLLKVISGIYPPKEGTLDVEGHISSMFELATGFEMEQNGWDNIRLRGLMLGQTPKQIDEKMEEIAEFSELGNFLNMPVKYYSSGMFVRLAFSISTSIEPDILLLDEIIAAGDAGFIKKANDRLHSMISTSKIMVLVTHSMQSAIDMCNKCIWMESGNIVMSGDPKTITDEYMKAAVS